MGNFVRHLTGHTNCGENSIDIVLALSNNSEIRHARGVTVVVGWPHGYIRIELPLNPLPVSNGAYQANILGHPFFAHFRLLSSCLTANSTQLAAPDGAYREAHLNRITIAHYCEACVAWRGIPYR